MKVLFKTGIMNCAAGFLHTKMSRFMIKKYIKNNSIDMSCFKNQSYDSFAEFFARKKENDFDCTDEKEFISPCDGLLSLYDIKDNLILKMKGSEYSVSDLIPDKESADLFMNGLCAVFRLEASDYHHFCYFDDCLHYEAKFIQGELHSVQPVATRNVPVYRLNRRWWRILETRHFGKAAQIEVGAVLVGGVTYANKEGYYLKGSEMGNFELCGSTIILMLTEKVKNSLKIYDRFRTDVETSVKMGEPIGRIN